MAGAALRRACQVADDVVQRGQAVGVLGVL